MWRGLVAKYQPKNAFIGVCCLGGIKRKLREDGLIILKKLRPIPINDDIDWKKPLLVAEKVTQEPTADLTRARYGFQNNFKKHPYFALTINKVSSAEFPLEDWARLERDWSGKITLKVFEEWVLSRRDLFPKFNTTYYLFGYGLKATQGKSWKHYKRFKKQGQHKNKWRALRSIASFLISSDGIVYVHLKRGLTKGTRKPKRKNYLIWKWFGKSRV
jgi:hypothetical protein